MLLRDINDNILIYHLSYSGVYQDKAKNNSSTKRSFLLLGWNQIKETIRYEVHITHATMKYEKKIPLHFGKGSGFSGQILKTEILMKKRAPQNG